MPNKYEKAKEELEILATKQQMSASNPKSSVWVEASAGTGKTKVLSDRVLRLLLAGVLPSKILCLTYTKAAAVEMNERIAKKLSNWAVYSIKDLEDDLFKLLGDDFCDNKKEEIIKNARTLFAQTLDAPGGIKIQTIHSFCQEVLKRFPIEAGISPFFEVLDDRSSKEILQNIKSDILRKTEDSDTLGQEISYLIHSISEFKFPEIMNLITENRSKIDALLKKYTDISEIVKELEKRMGVSCLLTEDEIKKEFFSNIDKSEFVNCRDAFLKGKKEDQERGKVFCQISESNFDYKYYDAYKELFYTQKGEKLVHFARKDAINAYPMILDFMNSEFERVEKAENTIKSIRVFRSTKALLYISKNIIDAYNNYKEIYSVLDYEDLVVKTRTLLENKENADWVLFKLDGGIDHILIDEAQDTSPSQWAIIRAITEEFFAGKGAFEGELKRSLFVVGDRKQSIYSFQGADPQEFDRMYNYFTNKSSDFMKVHLDVSFRSTKAIMDCVNLLFDVDEVKKGVIAEGQKINHSPFRLGEEGCVEVSPIVRPEKDDNENNNYNWHIPLHRIQKSSPSNLLAKKIAKNIKQMVENKEILASKNRPIRYGDFMFLVQRRNSFVEEFVRACKEIGVNVEGVDKLKLLEQIAVLDLISLGKFILFPYDDLSLAEVLKSPIFNLNDDDLFELCYGRESSLYNSISDNPKYKNVKKELNVLINLNKYMRPFELYSYVLSTMKGREKYITRMGREVEDVLDEFLSLTIDFEQKNIPSLENFISWIVKDEVIVKKEMEQGDSDTVKIMTAHGSKGLQAPIVILADTVRVKNYSKTADFLWDNDLFYFPLSSNCYNNRCCELADSLANSGLEEYRRLLYVALTRAEDRLYIAGYTTYKNIKNTSWYSLLENNLKSNIEVLSSEQKVVYKIEQESDFVPQNKKEKKKNRIEKNYQHLLSAAPKTPTTPKTISPSRLVEEDDEVISSPIEDDGNFYQRGTTIHKLLEYITKVDESLRYDAIITFLKKELPLFPYEEYDKIAYEVSNLCDKFPDLFSKESLSEVPIVGKIDGDIISSKIDKLIVKDNEVIIVDYKTNRKTPQSLQDVPKLYISQLKTYKKLVGAIYPNKEITTYLLWTNTCNLMKV